MSIRTQRDAMRFINAIFTATPGEVWANRDILPHYENAIDTLPLMGPERDKLMDAVRYFLVGQRTRYTVSNWLVLRHFSERAAAFEAGAEQALAMLAGQIEPVARAAGIVFDAILTTTSTGNLMPGLSYRLASRLHDLVRPDSMFIDLGNVGCTGGLKTLHLANQLDGRFQNVLIVAVEMPTTLVNWTATETDVWQGNCTFGDGAAALWVSTTPGHAPLALDDLQYVQQAHSGLNLIRWGYADYYSFRLADEKAFQQDVRAFVTHALADVGAEQMKAPHWAIHPAGITLLLRLSRKLGLPKKAIQPSANHYERFSNMSSASILHILKEMAENVSAGESVRLLTMGAGFNVMYGRVRKE